MKYCLTKIWKPICLLILFNLGLALSAPIAVAKPPPWAPAHGYRAKYKYYYYPAQRVYYSIDRRRYYWLDNNVWRMSVNIPRTINLGNRVAVDLDSPVPYTYDSYFIQYYPPPAIVVY